MNNKLWMSAFFVAMLLFFSVNAKATSAIGKPVSHALIASNCFSFASVDNRTSDVLDTLTWKMQESPDHTLLAHEERLGRRGNEDSQHTTGYVGDHQDQNRETPDHRRRENEEGQHTTGYVGDHQDQNREAPDHRRRDNEDSQHTTGYVGGMHEDDNGEAQGNEQTDSEDRRR